MTKKEEFMKISTYEEYLKRKNEFKDITIDTDVLKHVSDLFPKATGSNEELLKTPPSKGGTIGR